MQVPGTDNAGPGSDILGLEMMLEGLETVLEKKKANGITLRSKFIFYEIFISEWTLSLNRLSRQYKLDSLEVIGPIVAHLSSKFLSLQLDNFLLFALCLRASYCILHATKIFFTLQSI